MSQVKGWIVCLGVVTVLVWVSPALAGRPLEQPRGQKQTTATPNLQQQKKAMRSGGANKIPRGNPPGWAPATGLRQQTGSGSGNLFPTGVQKKSRKRSGQTGFQGGQSGQMGTGGQIGTGGQMGTGSQPGQTLQPMSPQGQPGSLR